MKKNLLLLGAALLMTASAMAQTYTNPRTMAAPPTFANAATFNYAAEEGGDSLYLWNVTYGGFYTHHQESDRGAWPWGTRAAVNLTIGSKIVFTRQNPAQGTNDAADESTTEWSDDTYLLVSDVSKWFASDANGGYRCTFYDDWDGIWTDNNATANRQRHYHVQPNGQYLRIFPDNVANYSCAGSGPEVEPYNVEWDEYGLCVRAEENDEYRFVWLNRPSETVTSEDPETGETTTTEITRILIGETVGLDWAIVTPEVYAAYSESAKDQNECYKLGAQLAAALNNAVASTDDGIRPYLDTQIQILNDASSTAEQLQGAIDAIADIIVEYKANTVTPENPADFTAKINNPDFTGGNVGGWQGGDWGRGGRVADAAEHWRSTFNHYQDLTNLPEGVYRVVVDGFNRINDNHNDDYVGWKKGETGHARLYVGCESFGEFETAVMPASAGGDFTSHMSETNGQDTEYAIGDGTYWYAPNSMYGFVTWLEYWKTQNKRPYGIEAYGAVKEGEKLRIGAKNTVNNEWVIVDNFELWYLGNTLEAYLLWASSINMPEMTPDSYYGQPDLDEYNAVKTALTQATTKEEVMEAVKNVPTVTELMTTSKNLYQQWVDVINAFPDWLESADCGESSYLDNLEAYMDMTQVIEPNDIYPNGSAAYILDFTDNQVAGKISAEQMQAELEFIEQMKADAIKYGMHKGTDLSSLIKNPRFSESGDGGLAAWVEEGGYTAITIPEIEMYERAFNFYQDIDNEVIMPGLYDVTVKAFYRTAGNDAAWAAYQADPTMTGEAKVHTYVYLNEFATPVKNCMEIAYDTNLSNNCWQRSDGKYTLNGMASAHTAFALADETMNFTQHVYGMVTDDEAGHIRLGVKNELTSGGGRWTLFGHFGLRYMGKDAEGLKQVIANYLDRDTGVDMLAILDGAYEDWTTAMDNTEGYENIEGDANGDSDELFTMTMDLVKAWNDLDKSAKLVTELSDALEALDEYMAEHDDYDPSLASDIMDWMDERYDDLGDGSDTPHGTIEDYEGYIELAQDYLDQLKESGLDITTLPVNLTSWIVNPDYANDNNDGWNGPSGFDGHQVNEAYNQTFEEWQEIKVPFDGYYLLTVRAYERLGSSSNDYSILQAGTYAENIKTYMYAQVGDDTYVNHLLQASHHLFDVNASMTGGYSTVGDIYKIVDNRAAAQYLFNFYQTDPNNQTQDPMTGETVIKDETAGYFYNPLLFYAPKGKVRIGIKKEVNIDRGWCCFDDWKLWYYGTEKPVGINDIQNDNIVAAPVQRSIFTLGGAKVNELQRGINIVRTVDAEGNVKAQKIFVK